jgi:hypothetical protein
VNSYGAFFYIAFYLRDIARLREMLNSFLLVKAFLFQVPCERAGRESR